MAKLLKGFPASNAARNSTDNGVNDSEEKSDIGMLGYSVMPYPPTGTAEDNTEIDDTKDNFALETDMNNIGTSRTAYAHQENNPDAQEGEGPDNSEFEKVSESKRRGHGEPQ